MDCLHDETFKHSLFSIDFYWEEGEYISMRMPQFELKDREVKKLTLSRISLRRGTHSHNRFHLPPTRIDNIVDCDPGEYTVDYALPEFDKANNVASPNNEKYGLALLRKQGSPQFYVAWGLGGVRVPVHVAGTNSPPVDHIIDKREEIWCKILPADDKEAKKNFDLAKQWYRRQRYENTANRYAVLEEGFTDQITFIGVNEIDTAVLDVGEFRRLVAAKIRRVWFLDRTHLDLSIQVKMPPWEIVIEG